MTKEFYLIPSKIFNKKMKTVRISVSWCRAKDNNDSLSFVKASIYASIEEDTADNADKPEDQKSYIYYVDKKSFAEGDVIVSQKDQSKYVVSDVGVLEGVYCINQGYAVFRRIEILDQNEEYAIASKSTHTVFPVMTIYVRKCKTK